MTRHSYAGNTAIVGIGATEFSKNSGRSELQLAIEACTAACEDAGLPTSRVDGLVTYTMETNPENEIMRGLGIRFVNVTAASPYYNPHIIRPALYPPSDGYHPPEDPFVGVMRQLEVVRDLKKAFPDFCLMGSGYTYLQDFFPNVAQAVVSRGWVDLVGLGRMVLAYPELPLDILQGRTPNKKRYCRTFSDCTTAPRNGIVSGCYPLDAHYKKTPEFKQLAAVKKAVAS